jgi:hypothetical protein
MNAMIRSLPFLLIAVAGCQSTHDAARHAGTGADPDTYVRSTLREARLAYERTGREMALAGTGFPMPHSADVPMCLGGLLTRSPRYLGALRRVWLDDDVPATERFMAEYCMGFQGDDVRSRLRIQFDGVSTDDGFCRVTVINSPSTKGFP